MAEKRPTPTPRGPQSRRLLADATLDRIDIAANLLKLEQPSPRLAMARRLLEQVELDVAALAEPIDRDPLAATEPRPCRSPLSWLMGRRANG